MTSPAKTAVKPAVPATTATTTTTAAQRAAAALPTVLVVDDEADLCSLYQTALQRAGYAVLTAQTLADGIAALAANPQIDCVVSDFRLPDGTGLALAQHVAAHHAQLPIGIITAYGSPEHAVEALKVGAFDYLQKPVSIADLRAVVARMLAQRQHNQQQLQPHSSQRPSAHSAAAETQAAPAAPFDPLHSMAQRLPAQCAVMRALHQQLVQLSQTQACVVFLGETGTGKELAARAVHAHSLRAGQPFTVVDCSAIDKADIDAQLFGSHPEQGGKVPGVFQAAQGGTVLLDEVGTLPLAAQVKLLKLLQERSLRPVGGAQDEAVDVRLMVSSRQSLPQLVAAGVFRQDLYYRLNVMVVQLPPLRERHGEAAWLAQRWLATHPTGKALNISPAAADWLNAQPFEGNVRELENLLERAAAHCAAHGAVQLSPQLLHSQHSHSLINGSNAGNASNASYASNAAIIPSASNAAMNAATNAASPSHTLPATPTASPAIRFPMDLTAHLAAIERSIIEQALTHSRYNRTQAALVLGLNLRQLRYRIEQLGIEA